MTKFYRLLLCLLTLLFISSCLFSCNEKDNDPPAAPHSFDISNIEDFLCVVWTNDGSEELFTVKDEAAKELYRTLHAIDPLKKLNASELHERKDPATDYIHLSFQSGKAYPTEVSENQEAYETTEFYGDYKIYSDNYVVSFHPFASSQRYYLYPEETYAAIENAINN